MPHRMFAIAFAILVLTGCGQKGPLYLPEADESQATLQASAS